MAKGTLHFKVSSPENATKLFCTILYERSDYAKEYGRVWHEAFDGEKGDELFARFLVELFPDGGMIGEPEVKRVLITDYDLDKLRAFIAASFEIRSANTTLTKIVDDAEYIQRRSYFEAKGVL